MSVAWPSVLGCLPFVCLFLIVSLSFWCCFGADKNIYQSTINVSGDGVLNEENDNDNIDEDPNENNDSRDEYDGLSDVNEDDITQEEVFVIGSEGDRDKERDQPNNGTSFKLGGGGDGRIKLEVRQLFKDGSHFREIILVYSTQEGFKLKRIRNERRRIISECEANGCPWRAHSSPTYDRVTYMLKTLTDNYNCLAVPKNRDVTSVWLGKRFETFIKENPDTNIQVLGAIILRQRGVIVPDHTLYRAKKYALKIGDEDHKQSYNKLSDLSFWRGTMGHM
ncbi:hypothetical protein Ddye_016957 [Dipteronia dyeriana]|uniref:Transposase MuDR plant domain-containing protein n=1 Tax=Dipteronia dyeriana TaxID=168575 RepID=A0AAD9U8C5_9ROSI|nr:hypothetical protein Ddye_016957 [Dipteronia dyeriana]